MIVTIYTDGGSLNNPGRAASAYLIYGDSKLIEEKGEYIGIASNNVAEYTALVHAFTRLKELIEGKKLGSVEKIHVFADSELMIKQVNGLYKVKHPDMKSLFHQVKLLEMELSLPIVYTHVLREKNAKADALVKKALGV